MPEKSRGKRSSARGGRGGAKSAAANDAAPPKQVAFEDEVMEVDAKFEELKQPVYKGKRLDDPINTAAVQLPLLLFLQHRG
jgi:hypothetical protein